MLATTIPTPLYVVSEALANVAKRAVAGTWLCAELPLAD